MCESPTPVPAPESDDAIVAAPMQYKVEALVTAEVQKQLDRERVVLKEAAAIALKVIAAAFVLLIGIFTLFGLTTWKDIKKETTEYIKHQAEDLIQKRDSETGVKQVLNDLVNRTIINFALTHRQRSKEGERVFELPKNDWDRLRAWVKVEDLSYEDFADALTILAAQPSDRNKSDANGFLSDMLNPPDDSPYKWMRKQPRKREAIMSTFKHVDMGDSATAIVESQSASETLRTIAADYVREVGFAERVDKLLQVARSNESRRIKERALIACAALRPTQAEVVREIRKLISEPVRTEHVKVLLEILRLWWPESGRGHSQEIDEEELLVVAKDILRFVMNKGVYFAVRNDGSARVTADSSRALRPPTILAVIPTSEHGVEESQHWSASSFAHFVPYWHLVDEAANAGDVAHLQQYFFLWDSFSAPRATDVWKLGVQVVVPQDARVSVREGSGSAREIAGKRMRNLLLNPRSKNEQGVPATWTEEGRQSVTGTLVGLSGKGFALSLLQTRNPSAKDEAMDE